MKKTTKKYKKPITRQLSEKFGGKWKYIPSHSIWVCDELNASAYYVAEGGYGINGNYQEVPKLFKRLTVFGIGEKQNYLYPHFKS